MQHSDMVLHVLSIVAYVAEAMTAALAAGRRSMDWMGVALLGCVTALGGGSVRDVLLGHHPLSWVAHPWLLGYYPSQFGFTWKYMDIDLERKSAASRNQARAK